MFSSGFKCQPVVPKSSNNCLPREGCSDFFSLPIGPQPLMYPFGSYSIILPSDLNSSSFSFSLIFLNTFLVHLRESKSKMFVITSVFVHRVELPFHSCFLPAFWLFPKWPGTGKQEEKSKSCFGTTCKTVVGKNGV